MRFLNHIVATALLATAAANAAQPDSSSNQSPAHNTPAPAVRYIARLTQPQTQTLDVSVILENVDRPTIDLLMPVWRPGKYAVLDPSGSVQWASAFGADDEPLVIEKIDKATWRVKTAGSPTVRVDYRLYANSLADRTRHVDDTHAFLSGSSVFMYTEHRRAMPLEVTIDAPHEWRIASGLEPKPGDARTLLAPTYDHLADSPIEVGEHETFHFDAHGKQHDIVVWHGGPPVRIDAEKLVKDFTAIVNAHQHIFTDLPYQRYVFLIHVAPGIGGGTEHLNSTIMQTTPNTFEDDKAYTRFLGLVSHELFHTWNIKQFRPVGLIPYDYTRENYTNLLWLVEGTTSYYDDLILVRAGLMKPDDYLKLLSDAVNALRATPGRFVQSLEQSSFDAWIKFNKPTPDRDNSTVNFYSKGALTSLVLDLTMRGRTEGAASLDDVLAALFRFFPLDGGKGYTARDVLDIAQELTAADWSWFFADYIGGTRELDFTEALTAVGLELYFKPDKRPGADDSAKATDEADSTAEPSTETPADNDALPTRAFIGLSLTSESGKTIVQSVRADGPAYAAGVMPGDELLAINSRRLAASDLAKRLESLKPGESVDLLISRRDTVRVVPITLGEEQHGKWTIRRLKDATDAQKALYETWLGQPWPGKPKADTPTTTTTPADANSTSPND